MHQARFLEVLFQKIIRKDNWQIPKEGIRIAALLLDQVCPAKQGRDFCSTAQLNEHPHCAVHPCSWGHFSSLCFLGRHNTGFYTPVSPPST